MVVGLSAETESFFSFLFFFFVFASVSLASRALRFPSQCSPQVSSFDLRLCLFHRARDCLSGHSLH